MVDSDGDACAEEDLAGADVGRRLAGESRETKKGPEG